MTLISILSKQEIEEFNNPPNFNSDERKRFFDLTVILQQTINTLRTPENKILFFVSYAYFKAKKRLYPGKLCEKDLEYACNILKIDYSVIKDKCIYDYKTKINHQKKILSLTGFLSFNIHHHTNLINYVYLQVKCYKSPKIIFSEMVDYLLLHKIALPSYRQFVNIISNQIQKYKSDIQKCLSDCLDEQIKMQLDILLDQDNSKYYSLHFLKRYNQSLLPNNIRENLDDFNRIKSLYKLIEKPFKALDLNHEGAMYLTRFVERNRILHLSQRSNNTRHVSLIAFIAYQYFKGHDILADILLQSVQSIKNSVREQIKNKHAENYLQQNNIFFDTIVQAKSCLVAPLKQIENLVLNDDLSPNECLLKIKEILRSQQAPIDNCYDNLVKIENNLKPIKQGKDYFTALEFKSRKLQNRVSGIVKSVVFTGDQELIKAIRYFQTKEISANTAPICFLSNKEQDYLKDNFSISLYKALLFLKIAESLKSGCISLPYSYKYRHLDDYLISKEQWENNRDNYIKQANLEEIANIDKLLSASSEELELSYKKINKLILQEKTSHITCRSDGSFIVRTPKLEYKEKHSISSILPHKKDIPIQNILSVINEQTNFTKYFLHNTPNMQHRMPEHNTLFATMIAYGCNIGIARMARISKGQNQTTLENTACQYMHIDNIKRANNSILTKINEIGSFFNSSDLCHTSSDGQKYNIDGCSLNANTSYKYHGRGQGVSSYIFLDNQFAHFYSTVISSSEREACYVPDGMMNNYIIKSDIHSTDTHGSTEVIFGIMHMMGIIFAPRLKNLSDQTLYSFKLMKISDKALIRPKKNINNELIKKNWEDILRFTATIKLRYAPASQLFKRLNSYSKQHVLYKSLKEYGRLRKTLFILSYMYDINFRQLIGKQLNRGENSNKFSKAVAFGNNQEILFEEKEDQEIAENCR